MTLVTSVSGTPVEAHGSTQQPPCDKAKANKGNRGYGPESRSQAFNFELSARQLMVRFRMVIIICEVDTS